MPRSSRSLQRGSASHVIEAEQEDRLIGSGLRWIEQISRSRRESRRSNERRAQALENGRAVATAIRGFNLSDVGRLSRTRAGELLQGALYRQWPDADAAARTRRGARRVAYDALNEIAHKGIFEDNQNEFVGLDYFWGPAMGAGHDAAFAAALEDLLPEPLYLEMTASWRAAIGPLPRLGCDPETARK
jgi:hypothetical protein